MHSSNEQQGTSSIKAILIIGLVTFAFLMFFSVGLRKSLQPNESQRVTARESSSPFDGERAYAMMEPLLAVEDEAELEAFLKAQTQEADALYLKGQRAVQVLGQKKAKILLCAPLKLPEDAPLGANTHGAAAVVLLELMHRWDAMQDRRTIEFSWGELPSPEDMTQYDAAIQVMGVGDCYLDLRSNLQSPMWMRTCFGQVASDQNLFRYYNPAPLDSDAVFPVDSPLNGLPFLVLADPVYGGSPVTHKQLWGTELDTLDRVCPESLQVTGDLLYHALENMDRYLGSD